MYYVGTAPRLFVAFITVIKGATICCFTLEFAALWCFFIVNTWSTTEVKLINQ